MNKINNENCILTNYEFIEISEEELPEVADIYNYYIKNTTVTFRTQTLRIEEIKRLFFINHEKYKTYLISDNNKKTCGFCVLGQYSNRQAYSRTAEITIYLKPDYTGKHIGQLAGKYLEGIAKQKDIKVLIAIITGENTASIKLFNKLGYIKCAHYREIGEIENRVLDVVAFQKIL